MSGPYLDIQRSLLAYCKNFLTRNSITGFQVFDFDAASAINELPNKHLIGISDYTIENQKDMHVVTCIISVCTMSDDKNLSVLRSVIDKLYAELTPGSTGEKFQILDASGLKRGYLTVGGDVLALSIGRTETRPFQGIAVTFGAGYLELP